MVSDVPSILSNLTAAQKLELARMRVESIASQRSAILNHQPVVPWITEHFWIPELRGPIKLAPYQVAVLNHALTPDAEGNFPYSTIVWSDIKKSAKSTIAAAVALWRAYQQDWGQIYVVANDLKQADSRVGYYMRRAIELSPLMKATCKTRGYRTETPTRSFLEAIPIDPSGEAGSNADMVVFSELWGAHQEAQNRMWTEMTTPPTKFKKSFRWVETYAGFSGQSTLLENLWRLGVREGEQIDELVGIPGLEVYRNQTARLLVMWNTRPRLPWQTPEYYAEQEQTLDPSEFLRVHRNQWVSPQEAFVAPETWAMCHWKNHGLDAFPQPTPNDPIVYAIDAGVSSDTFSIAGVWKYKDKLVTLPPFQWKPGNGTKIDFSAPEAKIKELAKAQNVLQWAYDEFQLHDMTTRLRRDGVGWFRAFSQNRERLLADKGLLDLIQERRIIHDGNPILAEAIENADRKVEGDRKIRLVKRAPHLKIDPAVCLSMACFEALRLNLE